MILDFKISVLDAGSDLLLLKFVITNKIFGKVRQLSRTYLVKVSAFSEMTSSRSRVV